MVTYNPLYSSSLSAVYNMYSISCNRTVFLNVRGVIKSLLVVISMPKVLGTPQPCSMSQCNVVK